MSLWKKNFASIGIHLWIILLSSLVVILPELEAYLSTFIDPQLVALLCLTAWVVIKKIIDETE